MATAIKSSPKSVAAELDSRLAASSDVGERLRIVAEMVSGRIAFSTSLGIEDQAVLNAIADSGVDVDVFTLDTGRHFPETLQTLEDSELHFRRRIRVVMPDREETEELVQRDGVFGFRTSIEARKACCEIRKVRPLNRALKGAAVWITGLRRSQSSGRMDIPFASFEDGSGLIKVNPIADWSLEQLEAYVAENKVPVNALHAQGFPSIGCQPCTRAIKPGEDIRAGRWWWENEDGKECGLHNRPQIAEPVAKEA